MTIASSEGHDKSVQLLLDRAAQVNHQDIVSVVLCLFHEYIL